MIRSVGAVAWHSLASCSATGTQNVEDCTTSTKGSLPKFTKESHGVALSFTQTRRSVPLTSSSSLPVRAASTITKKFPAFLPPDVALLKEAAALDMAYRMKQVPVKTSLSERPILTSSVMPDAQGTGGTPILLLHGFDSSLLEWRRLFPLLEAGGADPYAIDILGWGFNNSEGVTSFGVPAKREHIYEYWKAYIKKPVVLVGASLGGSVAIDFAVEHPDAVAKLVLIDAQGFAEGVGDMATLPKFVAYAGIAVLKNVLLRSYATYLTFYKINMDALIDGMRVGRLHTSVSGWADASVSFMLSGGYNVSSKIPEVQQETLVIWGEEDKILPREYAERFEKELPRSQLELVKEAGHIPHVEKPAVVADLIFKFISAAVGSTC